MSALRKLRVGSHYFSVQSEEIVRTRPFDRYSETDNDTLVRWLVEYQSRATRPPATIEFLASEFRFLQASKDWTRLDANVRAFLRDCLAGLEHEAEHLNLRLVPEHGDLWSQNILVRPSGQLVVLDWEHARPRGVETFDPIFFILTSMMVQDDPLGSFWRNLNGGGPYAKLARGNMRRFGEHLGIHADQLARWMPYVLLRVMVRHSPYGDFWMPFYSVYKSIIETLSRAEEKTWLV